MGHYSSSRRQRDRLIIVLTVMALALVATVIFVACGTDPDTGGSQLWSEKERCSFSYDTQGRLSERVCTTERR